MPEGEPIGKVCTVRKSFGYAADLCMGRELGYISIPELFENGAELDLYYTEPKTFCELLA